VPDVALATLRRRSGFVPAGPMTGGNGTGDVKDERDSPRHLIKVRNSMTTSPSIVFRALMAVVLPSTSICAYDLKHHPSPSRFQRPTQQQVSLPQ